jgi:hypothetical protein
MKSIKWIVLLTSLLSSQYLSSQDLLTWSDPNEQNIDQNSDYKILGVIDDRYYAISERNRNRVLYTFSIDHKLISKTNFNYLDGKRDYAIQEIIRTPKDTFFYIHEISQKDKGWTLYKCDYRNGTFDKPQEIFFERYSDITNKRLDNAFNQYELYGENFGGIVMSADSSHLAFVNIIGSTDFKQEDIVSVIVYDSAMNEKWRGSYDYDISNQDYDIKSIELSNKGYPYILAEVEAKLEYGKGIIPRKIKNLPRNKYYVMKVDQSGILESEVKIDKDIGIVEAGLAFPDANSNDYAITGYYSDGEKNDRVSGVFWCKGNPEMELSGYRTYKLGDDVRKDLRYDITINGTLQLYNGGIGFVSEIFRIVRDNNVNNQGNFNRFGNRLNTFQNDIFRYISEDIVIPIFDRNGNLVVTNYVQRRFESTQELFSNYALAESDSRYFIIYNTTKSRKEAKELGLSGRIFTDMLVLNKTGQVENTITMISERDDNFSFTPRIFGLNEKHALIGGFDRNDLIIADIPLR